ncbi:hypothetical protein EXN66_Car013961 [Channa argus]|uniref:Uncharacterized protein n=1 Tax=Channa argus TaxID=215402 RepID=A0A6G1Q6L7_CHAAH|nr:hypothetical protein EXN66_Car013961 [Channa argus]
MSASHWISWVCLLTCFLSSTSEGHNKDEEDKDEEDKDEGNKDEGNKDEGNRTAYVDLVIPAVFTVIGLIIGFCIMKKPSADRPIVYKPI